MNWYAVASKPRREKQVAWLLRGQGLETYLPVRLVRRRWSDREKSVEEPLFAPYVFVRLAPDERAAALRTSGVRELVGFDGSPASIPDEQIDAIRLMLSLGPPVEVLPWVPAEGARIRILRGPLRGVEGVLLDGRRRRVLVSVELLNRTLAIKLDRDAFIAAEKVNPCSPLSNLPSPKP